MAIARRMKNLSVFPILFTILLFCCTVHLKAANLPPGFVEQLLVENLNPVAMTIDHHGRIWLVEKDGRVLIVNEQGDLQPHPFITIPVDSENERGLLGIALHPNMDEHPYVYLYYTVPLANHNRISRFTANGDFAVPGSEEILLDLDPLTGKVHNGGSMLFDDQGKLYVATGEAAYSPNSQSLDNLLGKILRLNEDGTIPVDNPFYHQLQGKNRAIYAYGLRNPFSMAFDPVEKKIWANDVGAGNYEEINEIRPGKNYGWPLIEGPIDQQVPPIDYQDPIYAYDHGQGCAIVGAAFYRAAQSTFPPNFQGKFFFADYCQGYIKVVDPNSGLITSTFATDIDRPLAVLVDPIKGDLYYLGRAGIGGGSNQDNTSTAEGTLWKVSYQGDGSPFISIQPESELVSTGELAYFSIRAFGERPLSYQWYKDGLIIPGENQLALVLSSVDVADDQTTYHCIVSNQFGADTSEIAILSVTNNRRPEPIIISPLDQDLFRAGDTIYFSGLATDPEQGTLPTVSLTWTVDWHHEDHIHPGAGPFRQVDTGYWVVPKVNETDPNVWYRLYLSAEDEEGLDQTKYVELFPELSRQWILGKPGVKVNLDGKLCTLPFNFEGMMGLQRVIQVPDTYTVGDSIFVFENWDDGHLDLQRVYDMPEQYDSIWINYRGYILGDGSGLLGEYFVDPEFDLDGEPVLVREDPQIDFNWGGNSPDDIIPSNGFTVRWTGEVQAIFSEFYTFSTLSDDGVRLWINDSLIIDQWGPQAATAHHGTIELEAGERYSIRLEYMEIEGGAEVSLYWQSAHIKKALIPSRQLYLPSPKAAVIGEIWLDENRNNFYDIAEHPIENITLLIYTQDTTLAGVTTSDDLGQFSFQNLSANNYYLQCLSFSAGLPLEPGTGLQLDETTPLFQLYPGVERNLSLSYYPAITSSLGRNTEPRDARLYPNPSSDRVFLDLHLDKEEPIQVNLIDALGKVIHQWTFNGNTGQNKWMFSLADISTGVYWFSLKSQQNRRLIRFIKH